MNTFRDLNQSDFPPRTVRMFTIVFMKTNQGSSAAWGGGGRGGGGGGGGGGGNACSNRFEFIIMKHVIIDLDAFERLHRRSALCSQVLSAGGGCLCLLILKRLIWVRGDEREIKYRPPLRKMTFFFFLMLRYLAQLDTAPDFVTLSPARVHDLTRRCDASDKLLFFISRQ